MINLELYRIFLVVAEFKNITKASEYLRISQPAITKHIHHLEEQLGTALFIRTKKGVVLNEYGEKLFLKVRQAMILLEEGEREISEYKLLDKGTIKIGTSTSLTKKYLLKKIDEFHQLFPNIVINIYTDPTKVLIEELKKGIIDMLICKFPKEVDYDLDYIKLGETKYIFAANDKYSNLFSREVSIEEIVKYPLLLQKTPSNSRASVDRYLKESHLKVEPRMNIASSNLLIDFLTIGYGVGYVTKLYVEDELKQNKLHEINVVPQTEVIPFGAILIKNNIMSSHCKKFIEYLKENNR